ncbi:hypothetical protein [Hymenobacter volaticus]|uniref:Uncharacterized protein n=1 Tax=Hymenobacter volaticus TaxID=2932254 RepID=A0ABY4G6Y8_9BACT|nr:hypothetical protein [Hymenobacter volaticus]UOQ66545.1 hypothetical protein MUN86_01015 [Hymenobacter volaticus]
MAPAVAGTAFFNVATKPHTLLDAGLISCKRMQCEQQHREHELVVRNKKSFSALQKQFFLVGIKFTLTFAAL